MTFYAAGGIGSRKLTPHPAHWSAWGLILEPQRGQRAILAPTTINVTKATSESAHHVIATIGGHFWRRPNKLAAKADIVRLNVTCERRLRCALMVMAPVSMACNSTQPGGLRRDGRLSPSAPARASSVRYALATLPAPSPTEITSEPRTPNACRPTSCAVLGMTLTTAGFWTMPRPIASGGGYHHDRQLDGAP
jgi:hypothetical protein